MVNARAALNRLGLGVALCCLAMQPAAAARLFSSLKAKAPEPEVAREPSVPADGELLTQSARIGEIRFNTLQLFDAAAQDESTALARLANRLHVATRIATIQDQLLFRSGDLYQPGLLEESARL